MRANEPKEDNSARYVQITNRTARILLKILDLESEGVTIPKLTTELGFPVGEFIKEAEEDSRQFLAFNDWSSTKEKGKRPSKAGGRHTAILEIRPDRIITNPLSAQILLMLAEFSKKKGREVNEKLFMEHLLKELDYFKANYQDFSHELTARINFLIKIGDICTGDKTVPDIIWISWLRYHSQKAYLQLLVKEKLPKLIKV